MADAPDVKTWVEERARELVDRPEAVEVRQIEEEGTEVFELLVDPGEMGRVIGRQGRTVQALRTLLGLAADKHGRSYDIEIIE